MKRYNLFYQVHKGLRALLWETALLLQQTDFDDTVQTAGALEQLQTVLALFNKHAHTEDNLVFPAIALYEPALVQLFENEHTKDHALGEKLNGLMTAAAHTVSSADKLEMGQTICTAFAGFMVFNLEHMTKEEDLLNKALWKHFTDAQLHGITRQIISTLPPEMMAGYSRWMMRGLSNNEISGWLKEVKNSAPEPLFEPLMNMARSELSTHRWAQVQEQLTEGALLA